MAEPTVSFGESLELADINFLLSIDRMLLYKLYAANVIDDLELEDLVKIPKSKADKIQRLVDYLKKKDDVALVSLIRILKEDGQSFIADKIMHQLSKEQVEFYSEAWDTFQGRITSTSVEVGPINVHIMDKGESLRPELEEIAQLASAIATSGHKGCIKMNNVHWKGKQSGEDSFRNVEVYDLENWKDTVRSVFLANISWVSQPMDLFEFNNGAETDREFYLHVKPADAPLLVNSPLRLHTARTVWSLAASKSEVRCFSLDKTDKCVEILQAAIQRRMRRFEEIKENKVVTIPGFTEEEMSKFRKVKSLQDCEVYSIDSVTDLQGGIWKAAEGLQVWPGYYETHFPYAKPFIKTIKKHYANASGLIYVSKSICSDLQGRYKNPHHIGVLCDLLVLTSLSQPLLFTVVQGNETDEHKRNEIRKYSSQCALLCDQCLSINGECAIYVEGQVISQTAEAVEWQALLTNPEAKTKLAQKYPESYANMNPNKLDSIIKSLIWSLAHFIPMNDVKHIAHGTRKQTVNLLTQEQLNAFQKCKSATTHVFIQGLPSSGKTLVALKWAEWHRWNGASKDEILYVGFGRKMVEAVKNIKICGLSSLSDPSEGLCEVRSISEVLSTNVSKEEYGRFKYIIFDDVQNFDTAFQTLARAALQNPEHTNMETGEHLPSPRKEATKHKMMTTSGISPDSDGPPAKQGPLSHNQSEKMEVSGQTGLEDIAEPVSLHSNCFNHIKSGFNFNETTAIITHGPLQSLGEDLTMKNLGDLTKTKHGIIGIRLKQVIRNSRSIAEFVFNQIPEDQRLEYQCEMTDCKDDAVKLTNSTEFETFIQEMKAPGTGKLMVTHKYGGTPPTRRQKEDVRIGDIADYIDGLAKKGLQKDDIHVIIDESAFNTLSTSKDKQDASTLQERLGAKPYSLVQDFVGMEKPVIVALLGPNAKHNWRWRVAMACCARVELYWLELSVPLSLKELEAKLVLGDIDPDGPVDIPSSKATVLRGHEVEALTCSWNPKGDLFATGSSDGTVRIWNTDNLEDNGSDAVVLPHNTQIEGHNQSVTTVAWNHAGTLLATGTSPDGNLGIWNAHGELMSETIQHIGPIYAAKWNINGKYIVTAGADQTAIVWDIDSQSCAQRFAFHTGSVLDLDWQNDMSFASCSGDHLIHICKLGEAQPVKTFCGHTNEVNAVRWNSEASLLASCSDDHTVKIWSVEQDGHIHDFRGHTKEIYTIRWLPGTYGILASAAFDATVRLWDSMEGYCMHVLSRHAEPVYGIAFSPNGRYLASASFDKCVCIWDVKTGTLLRQYRSTGGIFDACWNPRGHQVGACCSDGSVFVLNLW